MTERKIKWILLFLVFGFTIYGAIGGCEKVVYQGTAAQRIDISDSGSVVYLSIVTLDSSKIQQYLYIADSIWNDRRFSHEWITGDSTIKELRIRWSRNWDK